MMYITLECYGHVAVVLNRRKQMGGDNMTTYKEEIDKLVLAKFKQLAIENPEAEAGKLAQMAAWLVKLNCYADTALIMAEMEHV